MSDAAMHQTFFLPANTSDHLQVSVPNESSWHLIVLPKLSL